MFKLAFSATIHLLSPLTPAGGGGGGGGGRGGGGSSSNITNLRIEEAAGSTDRRDSDSHSVDSGLNEAQRNIDEVGPLIPSSTSHLVVALLLFLYAIQIIQGDDLFLEALESAVAALPSELTQRVIERLESIIAHPTVLDYRMFKVRAKGPVSALLAAMGFKGSEIGEMNEAFIATDFDDVAVACELALVALRSRSEPDFRQAATSTSSL